tara:strand:+ start:1326 stop:2195 length:870 start_codon:yes stop_codon:yes gene_type:complete
MVKFTNDLKKDIAALVTSGDKTKLINYLDKLVTKFELLDYDCGRLHPASNEYNLIKFNEWLKGCSNKLPFNVFKVGNSKLPFLNFSTLPGSTCPGAGDCLTYCYSFKSWRYPAPFFSQCMNTILMMENFSIIEDELKKIINTAQFNKLDKIDFRLYVDGDFANYEEIINWMLLIEKLPKLAAYGYSKSLNLFLDLSDQEFKFPENYVLNLSNGGKFDILHKFLKDLHFVRGNFEGLPVKKGTKLSEIKKTYPNKKVFLCPGTCGDCTSVGHACGNLDVFKNYSIVLPIH